MKSLTCPSKDEGTTIGSIVTPLDCGSRITTLPLNDMLVHQFSHDGEHSQLFCFKKIKLSHPLLYIEMFLKCYCTHECVVNMNFLLFLITHY